MTTSMVRLFPGHSAGIIEDVSSSETERLALSSDTDTIRDDGERGGDEDGSGTGRDRAGR
jgi:hypothetical protein